MNRVVLQVPMNPALRNEAEKEALEQGFSSLQDLVRLILKKFASRKLSISVEEKSVQLSPRAIKRYDKMVDDIEKGRVKTHTFSDIDFMMKYLNR